jgi:aromatic ring-opening dioxygenase catalytic subunit (LigB family)
MSLIAAFATSHAYTFQEPDTWDQRRERSKANVGGIVGRPAFDTPAAQAESLADNLTRYAPIREAHQHIREHLAASCADAVILIGDDQNENFSAANRPQLLVYTGGDFQADDWGRKQIAPIKAAPDIALRLVEGVLAQGFDMGYAKSFADDKLLSHAHTEPTLYLIRDSGVPVVPLFVNAVHPPVPPASRSYALGQALRRVIDHDLADRRIVLCASGGLSHFSPSHPWAYHRGERYVGDISVEFDRKIVDWMRRGEGYRLAELTFDELIEHGEGELRQWIVLMGALAELRPEFLVYEPLFRSIMGMGVGYWSVHN